MNGGLATSLFGYERRAHCTGESTQQDNRAQPPDASSQTDMLP